VILNYGIAILLVAAAAVADFVLRWLWGIAPTVSLFLCTIVFVAWAEGPGPALLATALAVFSFYYFFLPPFYSLAPKHEEIPRLVLLALAALFVLSLSAAQRRTAASLRLARDEQQEMVKELQELNEKLRVENAERRQAEERRSRAEQELQLTVDTIPVLVARYRPDGTMDFRNKTWRDYTGLSQDNLEGNRWGSALHPDDLPLVEREWRSHIAAGEPFELEQRLRRADGEYRWHWVRRVPLHDDSGNVIKWYAVASDIEDRRLAEEAQRRSEAALSEARRELQLTIDSIPVMVSTFDPDGTRSFVNQQWQNYTGHISASIAHELNQPLAAIVANSQACLRFLRRETPDLNNVRGAIEWIVKDGNRASEVIRRVRALAKKTAIEKAPLDINDVVKEVIALVQRELFSHLVSVRTDFAPALPMILGDRVYLQQVIINLVMNGIEAMQSVTDRPRELVIRSRLDETQQVLVSVTDCGVGISAENADRLFNAFFTTKASGMGMGLSICRSIMEALGGRLWATANIPHGATFHLTLPLNADTAS
jgi:PAS domain S-box-containing protein